MDYRLPKCERSNGMGRGTRRALRNFAELFKPGRIVDDRFADWKPVEQSDALGSGFPELGTEPIPTERCLSPEYFALEREKIFKRIWLKVGRVEEIPNPRDYKVKRLEFPNTSVILARRRRPDSRLSQHLLPSREQDRVGR